MKQSTSQHLDSVDMTYTQHLLHAWGMALALLIHGLFPTVYTTYVSDQLKEVDTLLK
jgi:hypothetical protein